MPRFGFDRSEWFTSNADAVCRNLKRYFGGGKEPFTGRWFEEFAAIGDPNRFEPSGVVAVENLSVQAPPEAAAKLLLTETEQFNGLLRQIPRDQDLWEVRRLAVDVGSPADEDWYFNPAGGGTELQPQHRSGVGPLPAADTASSWTRHTNL